MNYSILIAYVLLAVAIVAVFCLARQTVEASRRQLNVVHSDFAHICVTLNTLSGQLGRVLSRLDNMEQQLELGLCNQDDLAILIDSQKSELVHSSLAEIMGDRQHHAAHINAALYRIEGAVTRAHEDLNGLRRAQSSSHIGRLVHESKEVTALSMIAEAVGIDTSGDAP